MSAHALIVLANGPDVRQFLHSGLADVLRAQGSITWGLATHAGHSQLPPEDNTVALSDLVPALPRPLDLARRLAERAFNAREQRLSGQEPWVNFLDTLGQRKTSRLRRVLDTVLSSRPAYPVLVGIERTLFALMPVPRGPRARLQALEAKVLFISGHETPTACALLWIARRSGVRSIVVQNSWKDAYARSHVAVAPDVLVVPSSEAAEHLSSANAGLRPRIVVQESLHAAQLTDPARVEPRPAFCARYDLDPDRPFVCYTAAAPNAVRDEPRILEDLLAQLEQSDAAPQLLVRLNPMEEDPTRWAAVADRPWVSQQLPDWEYISAEKWNAPRRADAAIWASTIAHSAFNISVPSTVTRDFQLFGKPVINIVFDARAPDNPAETTTRYWHAPFYGICRDSDAVMGAFSPQDLLRAVTQCCASTSQVAPAPVPNQLPDALSSLAGLAWNGTRG